MHLKVFVKLKKTLKTLSSGPKNPKKPKKTQKTQKNPKKPKKTHWAGFFLKKPGFFPTLLVMDAKISLVCRPPPPIPRVLEKVQLMFRFRTRIQHLG
jgi:hypothetical protein